MTVYSKWWFFAKKKQTESDIVARVLFHQVDDSKTI